MESGKTKLILVNATTKQINPIQSPSGLVTPLENSLFT